MSCRGFLQFWKEWRTFLIIFLAPLLFSPLPLLIPTSEAKCGYAILIMGTYWCTEVTHLAVTSLLPLFLFPVLGIMKAKDIAPPYFKDTNVLLLGGLIMAVAIEQWNVHRRIALKILLLVGAQPRRLMLGFMLVTAFISMWITNTATTAMMTPIMEAVLKQLDKEYLKEHVEEKEKENFDKENRVVGQENKLRELNMNDELNNHHEILGDELQTMSEEQGDTVPRSPTGVKLVKNPWDEDTVRNTSEQKSPRQRKYELICKAMMMSVCYSSNIGGTGTLTGTAPQLVLAGQVEEVFNNKVSISFLDWFIFAFPQMLVLLLISWLYLQAMFFGIGWKHLCFMFRWNKRNKQKGASIQGIMKKQYEELGPMSFAEKSVLGHFVVLVLFWLLRDPKFMPGWGAAFRKGYTSDATAAILISFSLFLFPSDWPKAARKILGRRILGFSGQEDEARPLLKWKEVSVKFPWNVILLLGSGFALAKACETSGLSQWLGCQLASLKTIPDYAIVLILCIMITFLTEFTSNTATATILLPVLASLAQTIGVNPLYLMIPATVCCSFAFMLPVATPPNAIVFATGRLTIPDMMKAGFGMNFIGIISVTLAINTWGSAYFGLRTFPSWAATGSAGDKCGGSTAAAVATTVSNITATIATTVARNITS